MPEGAQLGGQFRLAAFELGTVRAPWPAAVPPGPPRAPGPHLLGPARRVDQAGSAPGQGPVLFGRRVHLGDGVGQVVRHRPRRAVRSQLAVTLTRFECPGRVAPPRLGHRPGVYPGETAAARPRRASAPAHRRRSRLAPRRRPLRRRVPRQVRGAPVHRPLRRRRRARSPSATLPPGRRSATVFSRRFSSTPKGYVPAASCPATSCPAASREQLQPPHGDGTDRGILHLPARLQQACQLP